MTKRLNQNDPQCGLIEWTAHGGPFTNARRGTIAQSTHTNTASRFAFASRAATVRERLQAGSGNRFNTIAVL
ncbi:MAG: hypothetical protein JNG88_17515 [Phycisphaerales bacterium]|nr:hypothetical protein [Phycisphaerales bacterium]